MLSGPFFLAVATAGPCDRDLLGAAAAGCLAPISGAALLASCPALTAGPGDAALPGCTAGALAAMPAAPGLIPGLLADAAALDGDALDAPAVAGTDADNDGKEVCADRPVQGPSVSRNAGERL